MYVLFLQFDCATHGLNYFHSLNGIVRKIYTYIYIYIQLLNVSKTGIYVNSNMIKRYWDGFR